MSWSRFRAACGVIGPVAFTAAWVIGTARQEDYGIRDEHISGLAAPDARDPGVMTAGFLTLGLCTLLFADELERRLGGGAKAGWGPAFIGLAGVGALAAGAFRRDRMSNFPPPGTPPGQSTINDLHDLSSSIGTTAGTIGTLLLARRVGPDPVLRPLRLLAVATALVGIAASAYFARDVTRPGNGIVQRVAVSVPLAFMATTAARMLRRNPR